MNTQDSSKDLIDFITLKLINKKLSNKEKRILFFLAENLYQYKDGDLFELEPPSSMTAFMSAICGLKYPQVIANSINCFGQKHFCFEDVAEAIQKKYTDYKYYPGFGHPMYKKNDPRVLKCVRFIKKEKFEGQNIKFLLDYSKSQKLCINIAGLATAFLLDLGFTKYNISYFPIAIRMIGLSLIYENVKTNKYKVFSSKAIKQFEKNL